METFLVRPYDDYPYLVYPNNPYVVKLGTQMPSLRVFVWQKSNLFGDACPLELAGLFIIFKIYNSCDQLIAANTALVSDPYDRSEVEYTFSKFDFPETGTYYGEFWFKDIDDSVFVLPDKNRIQILVF